MFDDCACDLFSSDTSVTWDDIGMYTYARKQMLSLNILINTLLHHFSGSGPSKENSSRDCHSTSIKTRGE